MYKTGKCKDCNYNGKLIAGRCQKHYWSYRSNLKKQDGKGHKFTELDGVITESKPEVKDKKLSDWFKMQKTQIPEHCEECGESISYMKRSEFWTACIAHIVPKKKTKYPSVATHPLNRIFLCDFCHNRFDNKGISEISKFKSIQIIKKRFNVVLQAMIPEEKNRAEIEYDFLISPEEEKNNHHENSSLNR